MVKLNLKKLQTQNISFLEFLKNPFFKTKIEPTKQYTKNKKPLQIFDLQGFLICFGSPYGNRTRVSSVKGTCPNP